MRALVFALLFILNLAARAGDELRSGTPRDCHLYSWGKGTWYAPQWLIQRR